jgi:hypothetical protein
MTRQAKAEMIPCGTHSAKVDRQKYIKITSIASNSQQFAKDAYVESMRSLRNVTEIIITKNY